MFKIIVEGIEPLKFPQPTDFNRYPIGEKPKKKRGAKKKPEKYNKEYRKHVRYCGKEASSYRSFEQRIDRGRTLEQAIKSPRGTRITKKRRSSQ